MIEVFRKGFRLDIPPETLVTFKKAQNLNGIQAGYSFSNTISVEKTANNIKLLELFDLPQSKTSTLMNGYEVDIVLNGSIQLRNQVMKITKEGLEKVELYFVYSDSSLVQKLQSTYVNSLVTDFKYKKTLDDFNLLKNGTVYTTAFVETQPKSGLFVIEEMPVLINLREIIKRAFVSNNYTVYGDFFEENSFVKDYWVAPNKGVYQIYSGTGEGFVPTFDPVLDALTFLKQTLQYFNAYASVDDTYKTVVVNFWKNLGNYKTGYIDYSAHYNNYQDYAFQSKLAKRNDMTYADSGATFNSFFPNNLSSETKATYMASTFGAGSLNTFDDSTIDDELHIEVRPNGFEGEISAVRIFKVPETIIGKRLFVDGSNGLGFPTHPENLVFAKQAVSVSMGDVYVDFHKDYVEFILAPLITNLTFKYDAIMAANFSMTRVFFVKQLGAYWIPLELNYTTAKDKIIVKAMLVKKRKVPAPLLNDFNSVLLDFKEKALFPLEYLLSMYPTPPNEYPWDVVVFKSYDQNKNRLYINDILVPAASLPQSFDISSIVTMKIEANKDSGITPDTNSDSLYLQAIDTNGGVSNQAFINIKHTGVASLQSDFAQVVEFPYDRNSFDGGSIWVSPTKYFIGPKPNFNFTVTSADLISNDTGENDLFNLIIASEDYPNTTITIPEHTVYIRTVNNGTGRARAIGRLYLETLSGTGIVLKEITSSGTSEQTFTVSAKHTRNILIGDKLRVYWKFQMDNRQTGEAGSMDVHIKVNNMKVIVETIKTV